MAVIHPKWRTPAFSLIGQGIWAAVLTLSGRYDQLYTYVIFGMVLSYTLTVIGLFVLRWKQPDISSSLPLHRIPMAARDLRPCRCGLDPEHHHHPPHRGLLGSGYRPDRRAGISLLEAREP